MSELQERLEAAFRARIKANGQVDCADLARVALDAIREPTKAMIAAACATQAMTDANWMLYLAHIHGGNLMDQYSAPDTALVIWYRAMIDAER